MPPKTCTHLALVSPSVPTIVPTPGVTAAVPPPPPQLCDLCWPTEPPWPGGWFRPLPRSPLSSVPSCGRSHGASSGSGGAPGVPWTTALVSPSPTPSRGSWSPSVHPQPLRWERKSLPGPEQSSEKSPHSGTEAWELGEGGPRVQCPGSAQNTWLRDTCLMGRR